MFSCGNPEPPSWQPAPIFWKSRGFSARRRGWLSALLTISYKKKTGKLDMRAPAVGLPWWISGNESTCQCRRPRFDPWVRKIPWRRKWQPTPVFLPGESHGQRILAGYSPWGQKESDTTEQLSTRACTHTRARTLQWLLLIHHSSKSLIKASSGMFLRLLLPTARLALVVLASVIGILPE